MTETYLSGAQMRPTFLADSEGGQTVPQPVGPLHAMRLADGGAAASCGARGVRVIEGSAWPPGTEGWERTCDDCEELAAR